MFAPLHGGPILGKKPTHPLIFSYQSTNKDEF